MIKITTLSDLYFLKEFQPRILCVDREFNIEFCSVSDIESRSFNDIEVFEFVFDRPDGVLRVYDRSSVIVFSEHCPLSSSCPYVKVCSFAKYCEVSFKALDDYSFTYLNFDQSYNFRALGYIVGFIDTLIDTSKSDLDKGFIVLKSGDRAIASIYEFFKCVGMFNDIKNVKVGSEYIYIDSQHVANMYRKFSYKTCKTDRFPIYAYLLRNYAIGYVKALIDLGVIDPTRWRDNDEIVKLSEYHKLIPDPLITDNNEVSVGAKVPVLLKVLKKRYSGNLMRIRLHENNRYIIAASVPALLRTR